MRPARGGWVRIGVDTTGVMLAVGVGLAIVGAAAIAAPVSQLVRLTSGVQPGWLPTALWTFAVLGVAIAAPLVILSNRPASINLDAGLVRVAWRTIPFSEVRHVYRMPGGTTPDQFVIQLEFLRGLDARLPVRSSSMPNLTGDELEVLLELFRRAPIEPKPGIPMRSPIAGELGPRTDTELIADEVSDALQPFGRVSYAKPTLLLEVEEALARARRSSADGADDGLEGVQSERARAVSAAASALRRAESPSVSIMPAARDEVSAAAATSTLSLAARTGAVEEWVSNHGHSTVRSFTASRVLGWVIIVAALLVPWILTFTVIGGFFLYFSLPPDQVMGWWGASILTWPFGVWLGVVFLKRARAMRNASARQSALTLRSRGNIIPHFVRDYFASAKPERSYGVHVYLFGLVLSIAFLVSGLLFLALSANMVGGPYAPLAWHAPLGWLLMIPAIPVFVAVLRWQRHMYGRLARAQVEWRLLGNSSV